MSQIEDILHAIIDGGDPEELMPPGSRADVLLQAVLGTVRNPDAIFATNVRKHGAKGDDSTDNSDAIQSAIDAAYSAGGGAVYIPPGTYKITETLVLPKLVKLIGSGYGTKIKQYTNAIPIIRAAGQTDAYRCGIRDLWLGFASAQTDANGNGIQLGDTGIMCYESEFENIFIDQAYNGVVCKNLVGGHAWMNTFKNVKAYRSHHYGFNLVNPDGGACTTTTFINCYAVQDHDNVKATAGGFYIRNITDCTMIGCAVDDLTVGRALYVMSSNLTTLGLHVENCNLVSAAGGNIALFTISGSVVTLIGTRLENMVVNKASGEAYTFDINTDSIVEIIGLVEYNSSKVTGSHYSVAPDGAATSVNIRGWRGMFGSFGEWARPYKIKSYNGDFRAVTVNGKIREFATAMPTSGSWTKDDYVQNTNRSVQGSSPNKYIVKGWIRMTTGSANALGTDWFEDRALTGT